jgi:tagatose 6-phosphate kinase
VILAAGLTPAWQQIMRFERLRGGEVNRALDATWCASGKVLNVAVALKALEMPTRVVAPLGGLARAAIDREFDALGIERRWIDVEAPTRVCTTVLEEHDRRVTELVENAPKLSADELRRFSDVFGRESKDAEMIIFSGSLPPDTPATMVCDLVRRAACPVVLDIRGPELLAALDCQPLVVKPNRDELLATLGLNDHDAPTIRRAMRTLNDRGAQWVVVSQGADQVWASGPDHVYQISVPRVTVINPIGSGDCLAAGIASGLCRGMTPIDSIRWGIAAAVDNVGQLLPARLETSRVAKLVPRVTVDRV